MKTGFFTMEDATRISRMNTLIEAQAYAMSRIDAQPHATQANIQKARRVVESATSIQRLTMSVGQFVLAHPSEGLKVI